MRIACVVNELSTARLQGTEGCREAAAREVSGNV